IEKTEIRDIKFSVVGKKGRMVHMLRFDFSLNEDISLSDDEAKFLEEFDKKVL
ncbi:replication initiation protein, partial [Escherichia coli]|nr:replication initiation protein [Escherichia coli]